MTELDRIQENIVTTMEKLTAKLDQNVQDQDQKRAIFQVELGESVRGLFTEEAAVQRTTINQQFQVQNERVTNIKLTCYSRSRPSKQTRSHI